MELRQLRIRWSAEPGLAVAHVVGDVDDGARSEFEAIAIVADLTEPVAVDLAQVRRVDAAGWSWLRRLCLTDRVICRNASSAIRRWLEESG